MGSTLFAIATLALGAHAGQVRIVGANETYATIQDAIDAEADQEDIQVMLQCQAKLQSILAKNQKEADAALGGSASPRAIRRMAPSQEV
jgi:hypothetical protein